MDTADFAAEYKTKPDEELLKIHLDEADLTEEARIALDAEMHVRRLDRSQTIADFKKEELARQRDESLSRPNIYDWRKIFGSRYGKSNYQYDAESGIETFTTTLFFVFSGLPLIPIGTYRIEKKKGWRYDFKIVEKVPLDWEQVLRFWVLAGAGVLVVLVVIRFILPRVLIH